MERKKTNTELTVNTSVAICYLYELLKREVNLLTLISQVNNACTQQVCFGHQADGIQQRWQVSQH